MTGKADVQFWFPSFVRIVDSFSRREIKILRIINVISTINDLVIEPVNVDFRLSIPKINAIPEICPISKSIPFDVPSDAGKVISAPY